MWCELWRYAKSWYVFNNSSDCLIVWHGTAGTWIRERSKSVIFIKHIRKAGRGEDETNEWFKAFNGWIEVREASVEEIEAVYICFLRRKPTRRWRIFRNLTLIEMRVQVHSINASGIVCRLISYIIWHHPTATEKKKIIRWKSTQSRRPRLSYRSIYIYIYTSIRKPRAPTLCWFSSDYLFLFCCCWMVSNDVWD